MVTDARSGCNELVGTLGHGVDVVFQLLCGRAHLSSLGLDGGCRAHDDIDLGVCGREIRGELHPFGRAVVWKQIERGDRSRDQRLKVSRVRHVLGRLTREAARLGRECLGRSLEEVELAGVCDQPIGVIGDRGSQTVQRIANLRDRSLDLCARVRRGRRDGLRQVRELAVGQSREVVRVRVGRARFSSVRPLDCACSSAMRSACTCSSDAFASACACASRACAAAWDVATAAPTAAGASPVGGCAGTMTPSASLARGI